jgi:hypothetical protein
MTATFDTMSHASTMSTTRCSSRLSCP